MKILFACPQCDAPCQANVDQAVDWRCPSCQNTLRLERADPALPACQVCGNSELYRRKNFPHWLGMNILVLACVASAITYLWYDIWLTWAILIGTAMFDGALYLLVGDALVCYRCNAHYTGFPKAMSHQPFELTIGERYRQERLRREQLKTGGH